MPTKMRFALAAAAISLAISGCPGLVTNGNGSSSSSTGGTTGTQATTSPSPAPTASGAATGGAASFGNYPVTQVGSNVTSSTTWDGSHIWQVQSSIMVSGGATLTISPGATVSFADNTGLVVGDGTTTGTLDAQGTAAQPILFTSADANPTPAIWNGIELDGGAGHVMKYCKVEWGSSTPAAVQLLGASLALEDSQISHSGASGVSLDSGSHLTAFAGNTLADNGTYAIQFADANGVQDLGTDTTTTYSGNKYNAIDITGGAVVTSGTWANLGVPYVVSTAVDVNSGATLTISPGATVSFDQGDGMYIGSGGSNSAGTLVADGTLAQPITFDADAPNPTRGYWSGLEFDSGASHQIEHCNVLWGGQGTTGAAVRVAGGSVLTLMDSTIASSSAQGLSVDGQSSLTSFQDNTFASNASYPIRLNSPDQLATLDTTSTYSADATEVIDVFNANISNATGTETWTNPSIPVYLEGGLFLTGGTLTLDPGLTLNFGQNDNFEVSSGNVVAAGTAAAPVMLEAEDSSPDWSGLLFDSGTTGNLTDTTIENSQTIDLALAGGTSGASVTATGLTLANAKLYGLEVNSGATINTQTYTSLANATSISGITFTNDSKNIELP